MTGERIKFAFRAFRIHFLISFCIAIVIAAIVFFIWFPRPFNQLAGGIFLFSLLIIVDLICGPLLTAILSNPVKKKQEQFLDWTIIALLQLLALGYGLHSIGLARPVAIAFEVDRFVVVSAADVDPSSLAKAGKEYSDLSWIGPILVGVREPNSSDERLSSIDMSLQGVEPSVRPDWWQNYDRSRPYVQQRMRKLSVVFDGLNDTSQQLVSGAIKKSGFPIEKLSYLPLVSGKSLDGWSVLLNSNADVVGYVPMDGFPE